jgi:hypothetical protein
MCCVIGGRPERRRGTIRAQAAGEMIAADDDRVRDGLPAVVDTEAAARCKTQPGGRLARSGGAPGMATRREPFGAPWPARDANRPCV